MLTRLSALGALLLTGLAVAAVATGASRRIHVVATAKNATLHQTVLVNLKGLTLYSLSAERKGRFICTDKTCLSFWHPLVVPAGDTPPGVAHLATVKRPDGRWQVTFKGGPLYTFSGDHAKGDAKGQGFKDVGTWRAAATSGPAPPPATTTGYHY